MQEMFGFHSLVHSHSSHMYFPLFMNRFDNIHVIQFEEKGAIQGELSERAIGTLTLLRRFRRSAMAGIGGVP